jgi:hypothetical protein
MPLGPSSGKIACLMDEPSITFARATTVLSHVGEPKAACVVEHDIIGGGQPYPIALIVKPLHLACFQIDRLDPAAPAIFQWKSGNKPFAQSVERHAAIVADVAAAIRANCGAIGTSAKIGDNGFLAVWRDPGEHTPSDFDHQERTVIHRDRPLGEKQAGCDYAEP